MNTETPYHRLQHRRTTFDEVAALSVEADDSRGDGLTFDSTAPLGGRTSIPSDPGPPGRQVYLRFFGTGFRFQSAAAVQIGGLAVPILGAVAQGQFDGLDQAIVGPLPPTLGDVATSRPFSPSMGSKPTP